MSVFAGEEEVPDYEITQGTVEQLWQLATACREKERRIETIMEDMEQKTREYEVEGECIQFHFYTKDFFLKQLKHTLSLLCPFHHSG